MFFSLESFFPTDLLTALASLGPQHFIFPVRVRRVDHDCKRHEHNAHGKNQEYENFPNEVHRTPPCFSMFQTR